MHVPSEFGRIHRRLRLTLASTRVEVHGGDFCAEEISGFWRPADTAGMQSVETSDRRL